MLVQTSHDTIEKFRKRRIIDSLMKETKIRESEAINIARAVEREVKTLDIELITTPQIRVMVQERLLRRGFQKDAEQYERLGIPVSEIKDLIENHNTDNANMSKNPETIHKYTADKPMKQFALLSLPQDVRDAHNCGDLHFHDLEFFPARSINCLQHDLRYFIINGLKVDGNGEHTSSAGSAKNIETLVNHAGQVLMASQVNMSGGQSLPLLNVFMAPYIRNLDYQRIKQAMQMLIFNLNMSYTSRGGQSVFSSVNLELGVPSFLQDEIAWGPGGKQVGTYGDYHEEAKILQRAFTEVMVEGDSMGKPHLFPNTIYSLRKEYDSEEYLEDWKNIHALSAKFSIPYFCNQETSYSGVHSDLMGCRTRLNSNWTGDWDKDTLRTGNLAYVSLNMPRLSYRGDIYENLDKVLSIAERFLLMRRERSLKLLNDYKVLPFLSQGGEDPYYRIENSTLSFGIVGLNEMLRAEGIRDGLLSKEGQKEGLKILKYINEYKDDLVDETGYRWTVLQTPGETTAHRFATLDYKDFKDKAILNGTKGSFYYTNSTHVPVDSGINLAKRIKIEEQYHELTSGGSILHLFLGESHPNNEGLNLLTQRIGKTNTGFFAYTSAFSYCFDCNTHMRGMQDQCVTCDSIEEIEHYSRVTGYLQAVGRKKEATGGWNKGKRAELKDRYEYEV
jgi:ribonucleoside-triphosphate reductase